MGWREAAAIRHHTVRTPSAVAYEQFMSDQTHKPAISVIVPVRNAARSLATLLRSLEEQTLDLGRFEVIVVDNASNDNTAAVARSFGARVVYESIPSRARARNAGARAARSNLHACTDADCVADPRWLEALLEYAGIAPLVAGDVQTLIRSAPNAIERFECAWRFAQEAWVPQGWAATANLLVHADAFEQVGGFDTAYRRYTEDADFCLRAGRAGFALAYCPDAVVKHAGERALGPFLRRAFNHGYGSNQAFYRLGAGYRAWREPGALLTGDRALRRTGLSPESIDPSDRKLMSQIARGAYAARIAGSVWAEVTHAR